MMLFKNKYGEFRSGWSLVLAFMTMFGSQFLVTLVLELVLVMVCGGNQERMYETAQLPVVSNLLQYVIYLGEIGAILLLFYLIYKRPFGQMGLVKGDWLRQLLLGCLYGILMISLVVLVLVVSGSAHITDIDFSRIITLKFLMSFIFFIFVGFFEEILCRGYMMTALKTTRNKWVVVLCPAVIFGLLHALNPNVTIFSIINIVIVGVIFGYLMIKTGRLWAPIGLHITWNFFQGTIFGIPVSGTKDFSLMETVFTGKEWFTGGEFGAEGGAVCTVVMLLFLAYVHFFVKSQDQEGWSLDSDMPLVRK